MLGRRRNSLSVVALSIALTFLGAEPASAQSESAGTRVAEGPCTDEARAALPEGSGHRHRDIGQHDFQCRVEQKAFLSLKNQLDQPLVAGEDDDEVLGEMDVEQGIAAVAVAYPYAGVLFFDVSNPARPRFLSRYAGPQCEGLAIDVDCGAYVDLSNDGEVAFLSVQQITVVPSPSPPPSGEPTLARPGVQVLDVSSPRQPRLSFEYPVLSAGGVHTSNSHVIPRGFSPDAEPGEYLFSVANGFGIEITRVRRTPAGPVLQPVKRIDIDEVHDMFIQNDPVSGRVYLYVAAGFSSGFYVYDVTDPGGPTPLLAEWDLTPECGEDWYAHTIDVARRNGRRYLTMPAELFEGGEQSAEDQRDGCGEVVGNGDKVGPLWIVDVTNFSKLRPADDGDDSDEEADGTATALKQRSRKALVATWRNAARRPGRNLTFSPHNQQIVGNKIYLSGYHSGVTVLDASAAFAGVSERPAELGFVVPHAKPTRPIYDARPDPALPFFSTFINARPLAWDQYFYRGCVLTADMTGGFYSYGFAGDRCGAQAARAKPRCKGREATLVGTGGRDRLHGTARRDVILGRGGDDVIEGRGRNDLICGSGGRDTVSGERGNDGLYGQGGGDAVRGNRGDDGLYGQGGADALRGNRGDDRARGGSGGDVLKGSRGDDGLYGQDGDDALRGDRGDDRLRGGAGDDELAGGSGRDDVRQ